MLTMTGSFRALILIAVLTAVAVSAPAIAQDWSSFLPATFTGITLTPSLTSGTTGYILCLSNGATVSGQPINWIKAFYALGGTPLTTFTATDSSNSLGWVFDFRQNFTGEIAGWKGTDLNRLNTPAAPNTSVCGVFNYGALNLVTGSSLVPGFWIGFGTDNSCFFKGEVPAVPELPTALPSISVTLLGSGALLRSRRRSA